MDENAIFTAIPAGRIDGERLRVTIFVTPKLTTGAGPGVLLPITDFPAFADWPATVRDAVWQLEVTGIGTVEAAPMDTPIAPDSNAWAEVLGTTSVGEAQFQHFEQATVHSYPVGQVASALTGLYRDVVTMHSDEHPTIAGLRGILQEFDPGERLGGLERELGRRLAIKQMLSDLRGQQGGPGAPARAIDFEQLQGAADAPAVALAAATAFYDRTDDPWSEQAIAADMPKPVPPEFHSFVSRCADYPELLRHLGLAIDVWITDDPAIQAHGDIQVVDAGGVSPLDQLVHPPAARPKTFFHRTDEVWAPASRTENQDIVDGSLAIDLDDRFDLEQVDPDGAAMKVSELLRTLQRQDEARKAPAERSMTPDDATLPALRSTGVVFARRNRAAELVGQFDRSAAHEQARTTGDPADLDVADVTRGWRIDVQDLDGGQQEWFSLHERRGEYRLVQPPPGANQPVPPPVALSVQPEADEGYLKGATTSSGDPDPAADQYLHETLAGWDGWSLAVKRPGRPQDELATVDADEREVADSGFPLAAEFGVVQGSLPRLRFGRHYRFRIRAVDLSGGSIPSKQLDPAHERELSGPYQRWEPVPSPAVVPLTQFTEGESLMRMVIRSTRDVPVATYVAMPRVQGLDGHEPSGRAGIVYRVENERHLAPPLGSMQLAETHGEFDAALDGTAADVAAQFAIAAKESGNYLTLAGAEVVNHLGAPTVLTGDRGQRLAEGEYVVHDTPALGLPYLPDPLSRGLSLTTLPGEPGGSTKTEPWPTGGPGWHERLPIRVRIEEGTGAAQFDAAKRLLTVRLPKATLAVVRLASVLDKEDLRLLRIWNLLDESLAPAPDARVVEAVEGRNWMLTPWSELTVVHAVEQPLEDPVVVLDGRPLRALAETFSRLPGAVHNHAASTGRIDIDATWVDPVDDVLQERWVEHDKGAHVGDFELEASEAKARIDRDAAPATGAVGPTHLVRHEFGDTRHRWVDYRATATTRFREYFPPEITSRPDLVTAVGPVLAQVDVPSSARPDAPLVKYIVPTWEWHEEHLGVRGSPLAVRRVRTGGGLRVYLGRPWFSSGPDELLGVVLRTQPWVTWRDDLLHEIAGGELLRTVADEWAGRALRAEGERPVGPQSASASLVAHAAARGRREFVDPVAGLRVRTREERFLADAAREVASRRAADPRFVATGVADATASLIEAHFGLFAGTGPEGRRFTTAWGADPVFAGDPMGSGPFIHQFALRTAVGSVRLAEVNDHVTVVGHQPEYDEGRGLWYCDLQVDAGEAYTPFIQLALARYQEHSVPSVELSTVVKADFVQLVPRREATYVVTAKRDAVAVTLAGPLGVPQHAATLPNPETRVAASRRVEAWIERLPAGATGDLDWELVGDTFGLDVVLTLAQARGAALGNVQWAGVVPLPDTQPGDRLRVRLAEYEVHRGDPLGVPILASGKVRDLRLVYADELALT
ncbi:hypothetical protein [Agromyces sp. SYSU T00194]|uniref:hypothetical protein n=1 Tax=Agromyces chitinivorans TaxID=3158560 RepID=UPI003396A9F6